MKKLLTIALACMMVVALYGCGSSDASEAEATEAPAEAAAEGYTGTQEATAQGMGELKVTIEFENGAVKACDVDASNETDSIGQVAAPDVAQAIIDNNTPNVDVVSGATVTSNAIIEAAKTCFDAAEITY